MRDNRKHKRTVDNMGRVKIPQKIRERFGIEPGTLLEIFTEGRQILIKPYVPTCVFCRNKHSLIYIKDVPVCRTCAMTIVAVLNQSMSD